MSWLRVKNWERFQHYKDRRPPWIKFHVELLDDHELEQCSCEVRLTYCLLLLVAARTDNNIPSDLQYISRQVALPQTLLAGAVETLVDKGFLINSERKRDASKMLARRKQNAMPRQRREETEKNGRAHARGNGKGQTFALRTMILNGALTDPELLETEIREHQVRNVDAEMLRAEMKRRTEAP